MHLVEAATEVGGDHADEAGGEAALGDEGDPRLAGQGLDVAGGGDVLGDVQVVGAGELGRVGDPPDQVERGDAQNRKRARQGSGQGRAVADVELQHPHRRARLQLFQGPGRTVDHRHPVVARGGEEIGDHRPDLARADHRHVTHAKLRT